MDTTSHHLNNTNIVIITGTLVQDPKIYSQHDGKCSTHIYIKTTAQWIDKHTNKKISSTQHHHITAMGIIAEITFRDFKQGDWVCIEGTLRHRYNENFNTHFSEIHAKKISPATHISST